MVDTLYCAPGNGGIQEIATLVSLDTSNHEAIINFCHDKDIALVIIGPEDPLVQGLSDALEKENILVFGPSRSAAQLEGSKSFTKNICTRYNIPTASYKRFDNAANARAYVHNHPLPVVIKADGLAAGKGVIIAQTIHEALAAIDDMFSGSFGTAGMAVVIEEFLEGEEASFFVLSDGRNCLPLATAQDHKAVNDGDKGPNTGGMGAYSPAPVMTKAMCAQVLEEIIKPTVQAMHDMGHPFKGVLFAGLMITVSGPKLIEYNVRFGDPECQVLMMRLQSDLVPALIATAKGDLGTLSLHWSKDPAITVVLANKGYPGPYKKGSIIKNVKDAEEQTGARIFHAGTAQNNGLLTATGGRVLNVTATAATVKAAQKIAYDAINMIDWPQGFCRSDIGWRAIARETTAPKSAKQEAE